MAWENTLISPKVQFEITEPTPEQVQTMLTTIDPDHINKTNMKQMAHICYQLGELRNPQALTTLKSLNALKLDMFDPSHNTLINAVHRALLKYNNPELVKLWIEMLGRHKPDSEIVYEIIEQLGASGDEQAVEPIKRTFFKVLDTEAAFKMAEVLRQLGDDSIYNWLKVSVNRDLQHWDRKVHIKGAIMLSLFNAPDTKQLRLPTIVRDQFDIAELYDKFRLRSPYFFSQGAERYSLRKPWFYIEHYDSSINWTNIREKATTLDGLKELLEHKNPNIQRAAAYDLASLGDKSGVHLIEQDLQANDSATRLQARPVLSELKSK